MNGYTIRKPNEGRIRERSSAMTESQDLDTHQRGAAARRCAVSRDGHRVCIRAASPEDLEPLRRMFARISPKSMYQRFFSPYPTVPGWALEHAVHVDHHATESLVAVSGGEIVGQAMYVRSENEAEVAVVVEDAWQRRGIGTLLLAELAALAGRRGIGAFTGAVLPESSQMLGLASAARARRRYSAEDGAYLIHVPLESRVRCANLAAKHATRRGTEDVGESATTPHEGGLNTSQTPHRCYTLSPLGTRALVGRLERHPPKGR